MNLKATLVVALLSLSLSPWLVEPAQAMSFDDFAAMNNDDEADFVAELVSASAQLFKSHGQPDQASKVIALFNDPGSKGGVHQLASNLKMLNGLNMRNEMNPNNRAPVYQVEDALALTLKDAGLIVPASYLLTAGKDFQPSGLPRRYNTTP